MNQTSRLLTILLLIVILASTACTSKQEEAIETTDLVGDTMQKPDQQLNLMIK